MPKLFLNGKPFDAPEGSTVLEAARASGLDIPCFCWHEKLSVAGSCRLCVVESEEGGWLDIACNMSVADGMRVLTDSPKVREHRATMLEFLTLNHPVDCGICDKAGECTLQDYHFEYNGAKRESVDAKVHFRKWVQLNDRVMIDNERCIQCTRCVRFTAEISKSAGLSIVGRGDHAYIRAAENGAFATDAYSENVVDLCPVGALQSRAFLYRSRVWYLAPTPSVCPSCERGCSIDLWHRKPEWKLHAVNVEANDEIVRVTPRANAAVNGPWMCDKGRDLPQIFDRARAAQPMVEGKPVSLDAAIATARERFSRAHSPLALVSSWGSNEELRAFAATLGDRCTVRIKVDNHPAPGEVVDDDLLIRPDKNPNTAGARAVFPNAKLWSPHGSDAGISPTHDLVLAWGEGFDVRSLPSHVPVILLRAHEHEENVRATVFIPISLQTERRGTYTNFAGQVSAFEACFAPRPGVADAESLFPALANASVEVTA